MMWNMAMCQEGREGERLKMSKDVNYRKMIGSMRWLRLRKEKLKLNPLCQDCLEQGIYTPAQEIHHITPCETARSVRQMEELMFNIGNLRSLCHDCHVLVHKKLASHSKDAQRRNTDERNKRFMDKFFG